jgi:hypothetical protein
MGNVGTAAGARFDLSAIETLCRPYGQDFTRRAIHYLRSKCDFHRPDELFSGNELEVIRALFRMSATFLLDPVGKRIMTAKEAAAVVASLKYRDLETQVVIALDCGRRVLAVKELSIGSPSQCSVPVHSIWHFLISVNASSFVIIHNHPTGELEASDMDLQVAKYLYKAGMAIGFRLRDSIIVSRGGILSTRETNPECFAEPQKCSRPD